MTVDATPRPVGPWEPRAFCPCGFNAYAPAGSLFLAASGRTVCPRCARHYREWEVRIVRPAVVRTGGWFWQRRSCWINSAGDEVTS